MTHFVILFTLTLVAATAADAQAGDQAACPLHAAHVNQATQPPAHAAHAEMEKRGTSAMGFDQTRASHHFRLGPNGGSIEIHVHSADDAETLRQIGRHLEAITRQFKEGDFGIPIETHAALPDGVAGMSRFKDDITYAFEPTSRGGRVAITARTQEALDAVHAFLRYQIREHRTGDPLKDAL